MKFLQILEKKANNHVLTRDVLFLIFKKLPNEDLINVDKVCRLWRQTTICYRDILYIKNDHCKFIEKHFNMVFNWSHIQRITENVEKLLIYLISKNTKLLQNAYFSITREEKIICYQVCNITIELRLLGDKILGVYTNNYRIESKILYNSKLPLLNTP
jgi:hypothetical protein